MPLIAWSVLVYSGALLAAFSVGAQLRPALALLALGVAAAMAVIGRRTLGLLCAVAAGAVTSPAPGR